MLKLLQVLISMAFTACVAAQTIQRPKLVVGIVVDQMRWDFLYRYYDRYAETGGFKRMLNKGFSCENSFIPYTISYTACGHSSIYTGSVPAINGITGNYWYDNKEGRVMYCTEDSSVNTVGSNSSSGLQSPKNLLTTTICDELRLATNFRSKVVGIAMKDRGSILPAGHSANAAYWYDLQTGDWISSSYYMKELPAWLKKLNAQKLPDKYYREGWNTSFAPDSYIQSTQDEKIYESKPFGADAKGFPYKLDKFTGNNYEALCSTPFGNTFTAEMAKAAIVNEQLGADAITDFLAISFSSTDYVGHSFGPNSIETEDTYLKLDKDLGELLDFLDNKVGKDQYLCFLSADHGAAHIPAFAEEHKIPSGHINFSSVTAGLNASLKEKFGIEKTVINIMNEQVNLAPSVMDATPARQTEIKSWIIGYLSGLEGIARVFDINDLAHLTLNAKLKEMMVNSYYPSRSGSIQLILRPQWISGFLNSGTTHGLWNPYDTHIPLLWYGWNIKAGSTNREVYMTDIAPTIAALLHIQMPNGSVGKVIGEIIK